MVWGTFITAPLCYRKFVQGSCTNLLFSRVRESRSQRKTNFFKFVVLRRALYMLQNRVVGWPLDYKKDSARFHTFIWNPWPIDPLGAGFGPKGAPTALRYVNFAHIWFSFCSFLPAESVLVSWVWIFLTSPSLLCFNCHAMWIYHRYEKKFNDNLL